MLDKIDSITISRSKYQLVKKILANMHDNLGKALAILEQGEESGMDDEILSSVSKSLRQSAEDLALIGDEKVIEGVFDGEKMIAEDGAEFQVPANYASKSKLVEGDVLKLTINNRGDFLYKQIGPVAREKIVAEIQQDKKGNYFAVYNKKKWQVLPASVTFYKGEAGDEIVILVPKDSVSKWAAVENIVKK